MSNQVDWTRTEEALSYLQNELKCKICKSLAENPVKFGMCGDFFCRKCVDSGSSICPQCGISSQASDVTPDKTVKDLLTGWKQIAAIINPSRFGVDAAEDEASVKSISSKNSEVQSSKSSKQASGTALKASTSHNKILSKPAHSKEKTDYLKGDEKSQLKPGQTRGSKNTREKKPRANKSLVINTVANTEPKHSELANTIQPVQKEIIKKPLAVSKKRLNKEETPNDKLRSSICDESMDEDSLILGTPKPHGSTKIKTPKCHTPAKTLMKRNIKGETPLHVACIKGNIANIKSLLAAGANPNTKDNAGWTPLHEAVSKGFVEVVELLLDAGALVDVPGVDNMTPLHEAVMSCRTAIVRMLVSHGADTHARTSSGKTAMDLAVTPDVKEALETTVLSQNTAIIREPILNLTDKEPVLCCVGLDKASKKDLSSLAGKLNLRVVSNFTPDVTHLIVATDRINVSPPSVEVLSAILCGCWIVNRDWLSISLESNETVDPCLFEIQGITDYITDGPKRGRLNAWKQLPGLFNGCHFYLLTNAQTKIGDCVISRKDLLTLIKYGGGVVLSREPRPEDIPEQERTVPYHTSQNSDLEFTSHYIIYGGAKAPALTYKMVHLKTLSAEWLVGCIANFKLLNP